MRILKRKVITALTAVLLGNILGGTVLCGFGDSAAGKAYAAVGPAGEAEAVASPPAASSQNIRILIMNTDFQSIFHPFVTLRAKVPMTMAFGGNEQVIEEGEEFTIMADDARLSEGSLVFRLSSAHDEISVLSVKRALGTPSYAGTLEIKKEAEGLTLINELNLENYLTKVIPSEMPTYFEMEALKAQAVCARTYSQNRIQTGVYEKYGAHVDDSIEFQVYNNVNTDARAYTAVMETAGQLLTYNGIPVEGYFFSTSCGHTTDSTIWKNAGKSITGYIKGIPMLEGAAPVDLTNDQLFTAFIKDKNHVSYDSFSPFYRWEISLTSAQLAGKLPELGTIHSIQVTERGVGGIAKALTVRGTGGEKIIRGQEEIRALLGSRDHVIKRKDNTTITGWATLPSAYIAVEAVGNDEINGTTFQIYGGGYGHGVGMSQNGAQGMAKTGKNYVDILKFFFNEVEVKSFP